MARFVPDRMMLEQDVPRTLSLVFLAALTLAAALLNAFARLEVFGISAALTGFAFGGFQGVVPAVASEIFGLKHLATNYSLLQLGPAFCAQPWPHLTLHYPRYPFVGLLSLTLAVGRGQASLCFRHS